MRELPVRVRAALQSLPSVDELLKSHPPEQYRLTRKQVRAALREIVSEVRQTLMSGEEIAEPELLIKERIKQHMTGLAQPRQQPVLNGTGVVLHTGLGRAPLSNQMLDRAFCSISGYSTLELDLATGKRGERLALVTDLFKALVPSEGLLVVNNNAAAVLLLINTVAHGKEVIVSRGQLVEIGGSFRMPDVIGKAQAQMVEVGTTNRTHLSDYEGAISKETGALLHVHTSNYKVRGFTTSVAVKDLASLAKKNKLPLLVDLGSGSLSDQPIPGIATEPSITNILRAGADLVTFSGDKLLGGPQSGLIAGRNKWLKRLHKNPLYRALRCDKVTLALLEQTLRTYVDPKTYSTENLALRLLNRDRSELRSQADIVLDRLSPELREEIVIRVEESVVEAGSGSLPQVEIPSIALVIDKPGTSPDELAQQFRQCSYPVIGYVRRNRYYIDLKAIPPEKSDLLVRSLEEVFASALNTAHRQDR
jgi:L-seryl-tRNA(Ser) seleniumtransferase